MSSSSGRRPSIEWRVRSERSAIKNIGDLKGKRLGSFFANNSATFAVLSAIANESFGIPKLEDAVASLTVAPDAAVLGLMDQGELDAVLTGSTATVVTELTGKYKKIGDLSTEYIEATGTIPVHLALASTETYAADHCSELVAFSNACAMAWHTSRAMTRPGTGTRSP